MSIKIDIISGFLGAGKTTLIKKIFETGIHNEKVVLIENEFGEIGIDGSFLKESGVNIKEINSGCICCSLVGDFSSSMKEVIEKYNPDRVIIEPSGVGKLSDIIKSVNELGMDLKLNIVATVVDGGKCKVYMKNFGEFFNNQVEDANTIIVSKVTNLSEEKIIETYNLLKEKNNYANIVLADLTSVRPEKLLEVLEKGISFKEKVEFEFNEERRHHCCCHHHDEEEHECCHHHDEEEHECCHHHDGEEHECCHHHDEEEHECCHHHDEEEHECCHHHDEEEHECCHHHDEEEHECCHHHDGEEHECCHHHDEEEHECCHHHDGEHNGHHHHADEVFTSIGFETVNSYSKEEINAILDELKNEDKYGVILRAKGLLRASDQDEWYYFDYVSGDYSIRNGESDFIGKFVVIGSKINKENIEKLVLKK